MRTKNGDIVIVNGKAGIVYNGAAVLTDLTVTDSEPDAVIRFDSVENLTYEEQGVFLPILEINTKSPIVNILQFLLNCHGYNLTLDGFFGNKTYTALRDFREKRKLTGDTITDTKTWQALFNITT